MAVRYETRGMDVPSAEVTERPKRPVIRSLLRGASNRCMNCGKGRIFSGFLTTRPACEHCGEEFHHHRADDAPPYFTITIVGHIVIPGLLIVEVAYRPDLWIHAAIWIPLTLLLSFGLMRPVKGALIGLQWALYMHGFDPDGEDALPHVPGHTEDPS